MGPMVTVNVSLAGKLIPDMLTDVSFTTATMEKVGKVLLPDGADVDVVPGAEVGPGVPSGVASAEVFQNQL